MLLLLQWLLFVIVLLQWLLFVIVLLQWLLFVIVLLQWLLFVIVFRMAKIVASSLNLIPSSVLFFFIHTIYC